MDILFIACCPPYPPDQDLQALLYHLAYEFSTHRHVLDMVCFYDEPEALADVPRYETIARKLHLIKTPERDLAGRLKLKKPYYPDSADKAWSKDMWLTIEGLVRSSHYDIVHLFGGIEVYEYLPLVETFPTVISPVQVQSQQVNPMNVDWWSRRTEQQRQQWLQEYEHWIYRRFKQVTVTTSEDEKSLQRLDPEMLIQTMLFGVDVDYFAPTGYEPEKPALLFSGDFAKAADRAAALSLCQDIFPAVQKAVPGTHLYIVGPNPPDELKKQASSAIDVTGAVPDVRPLYELSTIYVSPIQSYSGYHKEVLQALAMMKPVVATPASLAGLELRHDQEVMVSKTPAEMSKSIIHLLQDDQLRLKFQMNGRQRVDKTYSWQEISENYLELYRRLKKRY